MLAPALRKYVAHSYLPLSTGAAISLSRLGDRSIIPAMRKWLQRADDEGYRGAAAEALGNLADKDSTAALQAALEREPFEWVRRNIRQALAKLGAARGGL